MLLMLLYRERQNCLDAERLAPFKRFVCLRQLIINVCVYVCVLGGDMEETGQDFQTGLCPGSLESSISLQFGDHGVRCCVGITCWCFLICFFWVACKFSRAGSMGVCGFVFTLLNSLLAHHCPGDAQIPRPAARVTVVWATIGPIFHCSSETGFFVVSA